MILLALRTAVKAPLHFRCPRFHAGPTRNPAVHAAAFETSRPLILARMAPSRRRPGPFRSVQPNDIICLPSHDSESPLDP